MDPDKLAKPRAVIVPHCLCITPGFKHRVGLDLTKMLLFYMYINLVDNDWQEMCLKTVFDIANQIRVKKYKE